MKVRRPKYERLFRISLTLFVISLLLLIICTLVRCHVENELEKVKTELSEISAEYKTETIAYKNIEVASESMEIAETVEICSTNTFKSWMDYQSITDETSDQWSLQQSAITDENYGFRMIDGYILVAMGDEYGPVGTKYLIEFEDGKVIHVMIGDIKHEGCTSSADGSMLEIIISTDYLPDSIKTSGNFNDLFQGSIVSIRKVD